MDCFAALAMTENKKKQGAKLMATSTAPAAKSGLYADPREDWLAQYTEEIIDPARPIVDPHHHLWDRGGLRYMIEEMCDDIASGHNITATVYVQPFKELYLYSKFDWATDWGRRSDIL